MEEEIYYVRLGQCKNRKCDRLFNQRQPWIQKRTFEQSLRLHVASVLLV